MMSAPRLKSLSISLVLLAVACGPAGEAPREDTAEAGTALPPDAGAAAPTAGGDAPGDTKASPPPVEDQGEGDGSDVVAIGDSYMRLPNIAQQPGSEGVDISLQKLAARPYRTFAYTGARLFPPSPVGIENGVIPGQFERAKEGGTVKTVLATGGGNDLPQGGGPCKGATTAEEISAECKTLVDGINTAIDDLVADMAKQGVKDLFWIGYGPTSPDKGLEGAIAALRADRKAKCVATDAKLGLRCHYIDNVAAKIPTRDGFHPTAEGYDAIAKAVFDRMKKEGARR